MDVLNRSPSYKSIPFFFFISLFVWVLASCGGGGSSSSSGGSSGTVLNGQFIDSAVQGIRYETTTQSGTTDASGTFSYESGETVRFYVGSILIGEVLGSSIITPIELVGATDETDRTVTNIARFMQTLDDDGNPDNGIVITSAVSNAALTQINFDQSIDDFTNDGEVQTLIASLTATTSAGARSLITAAEAQNHLSSTIFNAFSGDWSGSFSGDDSGTWSVTISSTGEISGNGNSNQEGSFTITGNINTSGNANFAAGSASIGASFSGTFDYAQGTASGSWSNSLFSGSWSGTRDSSSSNDGGDPGNNGANDAGADLTLAGEDTTAIGTSYTTPGSSGFLTMDGISTNLWQDGVGRVLTVSYIDGALNTVILVLVNSSNPDLVHSYATGCGLIGADCSNISTNFETGEIVFSGHSLSAGTNEGNQATEPLTLTGSVFANVN